MSIARTAKHRAPEGEQPPKRHGFTLLDVLVVVAIISLFMAILLPAMQSARVQSQAVSCLMNERSIARAWYSYARDHHGFGPFGPDINVNYGGRQGHLRRYQTAKPLNTYLGLPLVARVGGELFLCPSDRGSAAIQPRMLDYYGTSYRANPFVTCDRLHDPDLDARSTGGRTPLLAGLDKGVASKLILVGDFGWVSRLEGAEEKMCWHRRESSFNVAFADGHAMPVKIERGQISTREYVLTADSSSVRELSAGDSSRHTGRAISLGLGLNLPILLGQPDVFRKVLPSVADCDEAEADAFGVDSPAG